MRLVEASQRFALCARDVCPLAVRRDCAERFEQTDREIPTIVIGARDETGAAIEDVTVLVAGKPFARAARGASQPIDPGTYVFRFERAGYEPLEREIVARATEKGQALVVTMKSLQRVLAEPSVAERGELPATQASSDPRRPSPVAAYATLGAGVASLALGLGFGAAVAVRCGGLFRSSCDTVREAPLDERRDRQASLDTQAWVANVAVGAGLVLGAVGAYLLVTHHADARKAMRVTPTVAGHGGQGAGLSLGGAF